MPKRDYKKCPICNGKTDYGGFLCDKCKKDQEDKMVYIKIGVSDIIFEELVETISCQQLGNNKAKKVHKIDGKYYVANGAVYCGGGIGLPSELTGHEVVPLELHKGPTFTSEQLWINGSGGYFHGNNQKFSCRGKEWVVVPYIHVEFYVTVVQSTMF